MEEALRHYYLKQLGVTPWVRRDVEKTQPLASNQLQSQVLSEKARISSNACEEQLNELAKEVASCEKCPLHVSRSQSVFAQGSASAKLMIIGEAPGFHEDKQGKPFVGKAGQLLDKMLFSIGLSKEEVYIANVIKCRPPENRDPHEDEIKACSQYLKKQIALVNPKLILGVGRFAGQFLLGQKMPLSQMRKKSHQYEEKPVLVSYHPVYLLRSPQDKKQAFDDLLEVKRFLAKDDS